MKRNYGFPIDLYKILKSDIDTTTGAKSIQKQRCHVRKAVILNAALLRRNFQYDMSYVAANHKFSYGGYFDTETLAVIVECNDFPRGIEFNEDDFAIYDRKRYTFDKVDILEHKLAIAITMRQAKGVSVEESLDLKVVSILAITQEVQYAT